MSPCWSFQKDIRKRGDFKSFLSHRKGGKIGGYRGRGGPPWDLPGSGGASWEENDIGVGLPERLRGSDGLKGGRGKHPPELTLCGSIWCADQR